MQQGGELGGGGSQILPKRANKGEGGTGEALGRSRRQYQKNAGLKLACCCRVSYILKSSSLAPSQARQMAGQGAATPCTGAPRCRAAGSGCRQRPPLAGSQGGGADELAEFIIVHAIDLLGAAATQRVGGRGTGWETGPLLEARRQQQPGRVWPGTRQTARAAAAAATAAQHVDWPGQPLTACDGHRGCAASAGWRARQRRRRPGSASAGRRASCGGLGCRWMAPHPGKTVECRPLWYNKGGGAAGAGGRRAGKDERGGQAGVSGGGTGQGADRAAAVKLIGTTWHRECGLWMEVAIVAVAPPRPPPLQQLPLPAGRRAAGTQPHLSAQPQLTCRALRQQVGQRGARDLEG
jgi:hypothetical protein